MITYREYQDGKSRVNFMNKSRFKIIAPKDLEDYRVRAGAITDASWPEFMLHDPIANEHWHELFDRFEEYQFALMDAETNRMAAMANSLPFYWDKPLEELPEGGWDWVFLDAIECHKKGWASLRCMAASPCKGRSEDYQAMSRSDDDSRFTRRMGGVDSNEISSKRTIHYPGCSQPD